MLSLDLVGHCRTFKSVDVCSVDDSTAVADRCWCLTVLHNYTTPATISIWGDRFVVLVGLPTSVSCSYSSAMPPTFWSIQFHTSETVLCTRVRLCQPWLIFSAEAWWGNVPIELASNDQIARNCAVSTVFVLLQEEAQRLRVVWTPVTWCDGKRVSISRKKHPTIMLRSESVSNNHLWSWLRPTIRPLCLWWSPVMVVFPWDQLECFKWMDIVRMWCDTWRFLPFDCIISEK